MGAKQFKASSEEKPVVSASARAETQISITVAERVYLFKNAGVIQSSDISNIYVDAAVLKKTISIPLSAYIQLIRKQPVRSLTPSEVGISLQRRLELAGITDTRDYDQRLNDTNIILSQGIYDLIINPLATGQVFRKGKSRASTVMTSMSKVELVDDRERAFLDSVALILSPYEVSVLSQLAVILKGAKNAREPLLKQSVLSIIMGLWGNFELISSGTISDNVISRSIKEIRDRSLESSTLDMPTKDKIKKACKVTRWSSSEQAILSKTRPVFSAVNLIIYLSNIIIITSEKPRYLLALTKEEFTSERAAFAQELHRKRQSFFFNLLTEVVSEKCLAYIKALSNMLPSPEASHLIAALITSTICEKKSVDDVISEITGLESILSLLASCQALNDVIPNPNDQIKQQCLEVFIRFLDKPHYLSDELMSTRRTPCRVDRRFIDILKTELLSITDQNTENAQPNKGPGELSSRASTTSSR